MNEQHLETIIQELNYRISELLPIAKTKHQVVDYLNAIYDARDAAINELNRIVERQ
jgi:hypothetical protein